MIRHVIRVYCDEPGCERSTNALGTLSLAPAEFAFGVGQAPVEKWDVRFPDDVHGQPSGWTHGPGGARCPEHKEHAEEEIDARS